MINALAWRVVTFEKGRSALAVAGIFVSVLLLFLQLGFFFSVPKGGMLLYTAMRFDILMASRAYVFQGQSGIFPRSRIFQVADDPDVTGVSPVYQDVTSWRDSEARAQREIFVMGVDLDGPVFASLAISRRLSLLRQPDIVLIDSATRPFFGSLAPGRAVEIDHRRVTIGDTYDLGTGFLGLGVALVSDQEFLRLFPQRNLSEVNLGLIRLRPGADASAVAARLRRLLPADVDVETREALTDREVTHWVERTSTGLVFGFGVAVAFVVGAVILYQTLAAQILRYLSQYAVLKAIGYSNTFLAGVVLRVAGLMAAFAFVPAFLFAIVIYAIVRAATLLPIEMTASRAASVLALTLAMSAGSAILSLRIVRRADPVDLL